MKQNYFYLKKVEYQDQFSIDDIGNFVLEGFDDDANKYYLVIRTILGVSRILQIGPIQSGVPTYCSCSFRQMDYDDNKVDKIIEKFLSQNKDLTQIQIFDITKKDDIIEFTKTFPNIVEFLYG